jgi:hypothetical protein
VAVVCHETHVLDDRLRQDQPIERVGVQGWQPLDERSMGRRHIYQYKTGHLEMPDRFMPGERRTIGTAEAVLYGNFPNGDGRNGNGILPAVYQIQDM